MLRKKLLARLGLLVIGFVAGAVVSLVLLQGVLRDLEDMKGDASTLVDGVQSLTAAFSAVEAQAEADRRGTERSPGAMSARKAELTTVLDRLATHEIMRGNSSEGAPAMAEVRRLLPVFYQDLERETATGAAGPEVLARATELRSRIETLAAVARRHVAMQQGSLSTRLRLLIVGLTIAALAMTNIAIFVLVRTAGMILRPVGELIAGSRELAAERFDHRIRISQSDEFDELAHAYNALAEQLASNEDRKVKALQQLAVTLNHELNNAISAIDMQLRLVDRKSGGDPALAAHLSGIHANLGRMAKTIASLRNVRRVVVTDYMPGETMLDLPRCIEPDDAAATIGTTPVGGSTT